jgi:hypothetical protein
MVHAEPGEELEIPPRGLQPNSDSPETKPGFQDGGAKSGALPADLAIVVNRWPFLTRHAKATILGITRAARQRNQNR